MPDINEFNQFIKLTELNDGDLITFVDEGKWVEKDFGRGVEQKWEQKIQLPNGKEKIAGINKTSLKSIGIAYGTESDGWVGRKAKVTKVKATVGGKLVDSVVLVPVE